MSINTYHVSAHTHQLIVDEYHIGKTKSESQSMYHVSIVAINNFKGFEETGSVLSEFELNNKLAKK